MGIHPKRIPQNIAGLYNDIYISNDDSYYTRVSREGEHQKTYSRYIAKGRTYLEIRMDIGLSPELLQQRFMNEEATVIVHTYSNISQSWGDSLSLIRGWVPYAYPTDMAGRSDRFLIYCEIVIPPYVIDEPCLMDIISPKNNDVWLVGDRSDIIWDTWDTDRDYTNRIIVLHQGEQDQMQNDRNYADEIVKVNIALSRDGGKTVSDPLLMRGDNTGFFTVTVLDRYISNKAVLQFVGLDKNDKVISYCESERFKIKGPFGGGGLGHFGRDALPVVLFLGALVSSVPLLLMLVAMIPSISRSLSRLGLLFMPPAWPKEKPAWGIIYDAVSKKPIARAVMRIFSEPDGKQRDIQTSNEKGEFGFLVPKGEYSIIASATGFSFPSHILIADRDGKYTNLYRGGKITVSASSQEDSKKAPISINIPMDPSRLAVFDLAVVGTLNFVHKFTTTIRIPIMLIGTLVSIYLSAKYSRFIDWFVLGLYIILWALEFRDLFKKKTYGIIVDERQNPVSLAIVRIIDLQGKIVTTVVTGDDGKFFANINPGTYRFDIVKPGYRSTRSKPYQISKLQDLHRVKIVLAKIAKSEGVIQYRTNISS